MLSSHPAGPAAEGGRRRESRGGDPREVRYKNARRPWLSATMRPMRFGRTTTLGTLLLTACSLLALGACGDDDTPGTGDDTSTGAADSTTGTPPTTMTTNESVDETSGPGTSSGDPSTGVVDDTTGSGSGSDSDSGESGDSSTGDTPVGCSAGMSFSTLTSTDNDMVTNLDVAGIVSCNQDITITVTGGTICASDDGAGGYFYTVETLALEDVPPVNCGLAQVGLTNLGIVNTGDGLEVVVPQNGGQMTGNQSIDVQGDVEGTALGMPVGPAPLEMFSGMLPEGEVEFGADDTTVTYDDTNTVIATAMPEVMPGLAVTVTLTGLTGSVTFAQ